MLGNTITNFEETPKNIHSTLSSTTMGVCDPLIFSLIPKGDVKFTKKDIFPKLIKEKSLTGFMIRGPWFNIHTEEDVKQLENYLKGVTE